MKLTRAVVAGGGAALVVVLLLLAAQRILGVPTDLGTLLGTLALPDGGVGAWLVGTAGQVVVGAAAGALYAAVFEFVFRRAGPLAGLAVAVPHVVVAGLAVGFLPVWLGTGTEAVPGAFLGFGGARAVVCFVAAHLLFGALVGWCYGRTRHRAAAPAPRWRDLPVPDETGVA